MIWKIDTPKMKSLSLYTHPHVIPNLYEFLSYVEHKKSLYLVQTLSQKLITKHSSMTI